MILSLAAFAGIAAACGPSVHVDTLAAIARTESGFNTLAIGDNTARRSHFPATVEEAVALATALLREGRSLDLGLMQVNSANLPRLGMTVADAFDPCRSVAAGARVLVDGYRRSPRGDGDGQAAVLAALSHYNTGNLRRGFENGYVSRVQASAEQIVPALRLRGDAASPAIGAEPPAARQPTVPPPSWDVYGQARHRREGGAPATVRHQPPVPISPSPGVPVRLQALPGAVADAR